MGSQVISRRTIFIGDVHGCLEELQLLIAKLKVKQPSPNATSSKDRVILMGDLVNKGPHSIECIKYAYARKFECLMGNNDAYYIQFKDSYLKASLTKGEYRWFRNLPLYLDEPNFIAVHAGLHPHYPLTSSPKKVLLHIREYESIPWYKYYEGERLVIYGHWAKQGLNFFPRPPAKPKVIGLDSGCVYGKKLTAYILETKKIVQVSAKKRYQQI